MADSPPSRLPRIAQFATVAICAVFLLSGCGTLWRSSQHGDMPRVEAPPLPGKSAARRVSQFVFYSDTSMKPNTPLFDELASLREQVFTDLRLPPSDTVVQVYLFDDQDKYERYMRYRYPELPRRRAFFVAVPRPAGGSRELFVYTFWGDHLRLDLRHELTHALLNSVIKDVPLWLDEGLAEYYELPPEKNGINAQHLAALRKGDVKPDLATLEKLDQVSQMGRAQYQEAWAWTHFMLRSSPPAREVLLSYLQQLRDPTAPPRPLLPKLRETFPAMDEALARHLAEVDGPAASIRAVRRSTE